MKTCNAYPKFEPNQILTAEQLNQLAGYLEDQTRLTRKCLLGVGVACGLEAEWKGTAVHLSEGCGVTTEGHLIRHPQAAFTHFRAYTNPVGYGFFGGAKEAKLWQLLTSEQIDVEDEEILKLNQAFLADKVVLAYLERQEVDLATCTGDDCDEKGIEIRLCVRILIITTADLHKLEGRVPAAVWPFLSSRYRGEFNLPHFRLGRLFHLCREREAWEVRDLALLFRSAFQESASSLPLGLSSSYQVYRPMLVDEFPENPFQVSQGMALPTPSGADIQYVFDFYRDLTQAYEEFLTAAFALSAACCPEEKAFPMHLVLGAPGEALGCRPSRYRQEFLPSPVLRGEHELLERARSLFRRLAWMTRSYSLPGSESSRIKVTPSRGGNASLGVRAIPYYYRLEKSGSLRENWNFDLHRRCLSQTIFTYSENRHQAGDCRETHPLGYAERLENGMLEAVLEKYPAKEFASVDFLKKADLFDAIFRRLEARWTASPLAFDLETFDFFRIEGHLGKPFTIAYRELSDWIACYNLPVKLMGLKLGTVFKDIEVMLDCRFEDLEALYLAYRADLLCVLHEVRAFFYGLKFDLPAYNYRDSLIPKAKGRLKDSVTEETLGGIPWRVMGTSKQGRTNSLGEFEIGNLDPGEYVVEILSSDYRGKGFSVLIQENKELELGEIPLHREYSVRETEATGKSAVGMEIRTENPLRYGYGEMAHGHEAEMLLEATRNVSMAPGNAAETEIESVKRDLPPREDSFNTIASMDNLRTKRGDAGDTLTFLEDYLYGHVAAIDLDFKRGVTEKVYYPLRIVEHIRKAGAALGAALPGLNLDALSDEYAALLKTAADYRIQLSKNRKDAGKPFYTEETLQVIERHLDRIAVGHCLDKFQALVKIRRQRLVEIQKLHLFSHFVCKHPGLEHLGGVPRGGTFILVYDEKGQVAFDFALPYICCSDCPPVQLCLGTSVVFKLPKEEFCIGEDVEYRFITSPPGGSVEGKGVRRDLQTGEHYFQPYAAGVSPGTLEFTYALDGAVYNYSVRVHEYAVRIQYEILEVDGNKKLARVEFSTEPPNPDHTHWEFGDGAVSTEKRPVHVYDLSKANRYSVKLMAKRGFCPATAALDLGFAVCDATFTVEEIKSKKPLDYVAYRFAHAQLAKQRKWDFGEGSVDSQETVQIHEFLRDEIVREVKVTLTIQQEACQDTHTVTLIIPARQAVTVGLKETSFCKEDTGLHTFLLNPEGGKLVGVGIVKGPEGPAFQPSHPEVKEGQVEFAYTVAGKTARFVATVAELKPALAAEILEVDGNAHTAVVRFTAKPDKAERYVWNFDDGGVAQPGVLAEVQHRFALNEKTEFKVRVQVFQGKCVQFAAHALRIDLCDAGFAITVKPSGAETIAVFEAFMKEADRYEWSFDDGGESAITVKPTFTRTYPLQDKATDVKVKLLVERESCRAVSVGILNLPATPVYLKLPKLEFAYCDKNRYPIAVSPTGGDMQGAGIRVVDGKFVFIPAESGALVNQPGPATVTLKYSLGVKSAALDVQVHFPVAKFSISGITYNAGKLMLNTKNESGDADTFSWLVDGKEVSTEHSPILKIANVEPPSASVNIALVAAWQGNCPSRFSMDVKAPGLAIPVVPVVPIQPGPTIPILDVTGRIGVLEKLKTLPGFAVLGATDPVFVDTVRTLETMKKDLSQPGGPDKYAGGEMNPEVAETLGGLVANTAAKIRDTADPAAKDLIYTVLSAQTGQMLDILAMQKNDLPAGDPLAKAATALGTELGKIKSQGVKLDPGGSLLAQLKSTAEAAQGKPQIQAIVKKLTGVVSG